MKTITIAQIQVIKNELMKVNIPVQSYISIQEIFDKLPYIEQPGVPKEVNQPPAK